ncbi:MAG TPA: hypothetical protein VJQ85_00325 [Gaiellaceae bacterium]|nr:hypothetical protein [Gaiellaceae bacterium]
MELSASEPHQRLGAILVEHGVITPAELDRALAAQRDDGSPLGEVIIRLGFATGRTIGQALANQRGRVVKSEYGFATGFGERLARMEDAENVELAGADSESAPEVRHGAEDVVSTLAARIDALHNAEPSAAQEARPTEGSGEQAHVLRLTTRLLTATGELARAESARAEALAAAAENAAARRALEESAAAQAGEIEELRAALEAASEASAPLPRQVELEGAVAGLEEDLARARRDLAHATHGHKRELEDLRRTLATQIAERDAQLELARALNTPEASAQPVRPAAGHLLFFQASGGGYVLVEREGEPPHVGEILDVSVEGGPGAAVVTKLGRSPLPGTVAACAYLI